MLNNSLPYTYYYDFSSSQ